MDKKMKTMWRVGMSGLAILFGAGLAAAQQSGATQAGFMPGADAGPLIAALLALLLIAQGGRRRLRM